MRTGAGSIGTLATIRKGRFTSLGRSNPSVGFVGLRHQRVVDSPRGIQSMKTIGSGMSRTRFLIACVAITSLVSAANCDAQWGYRGSSTLSSRPAFRYQGPLLSFEVSPWYYGQDTSPYASSLYGRYRGVQPTQAEIAIIPSPAQRPKTTPARTASSEATGTPAM